MAVDVVVDVVVVDAEDGGGVLSEKGDLKIATSCRRRRHRWRPRTQWPGGGSSTPFPRLTVESGGGRSTYTTLLRSLAGSPTLLVFTQ